MGSKTVVFLESGRKRKGEEASCLQCSNPFMRRRASGARVKKYCSRNCAVQASIVFRKVFSCGTCRSPVEIPGKRFRQCKSKVFFCSSACHAVAQQIEGGIAKVHPSHYGTGKGSYQARAFRKSKAECVDCQMSFRPLLVVHHKDGNRSNNRSSNLEVVCLNHHAIRHMKRLACGRWVYSTLCLTPRNMLKKVRLLVEQGGVA